MEYQKTYNSPRLNGQFSFCSFPFALDTYSGCTHLCKYCFSYTNYLINCSTKNNEADFFAMAKTINIKNLERAFEEEKPKDSKQIKIYRKLIQARMPMHWGGISDPFSEYELFNDDKVSLQCLRLFNKHQYPIIMSTKSKWLVNHPEYLKEMQENKNFIFQVSLISLNERMKKIEPGTTVEDRLELLRIMSKTNRTVVRCQPFIPNLDTEEEIETFVKTVADCGVSAVTMEFMKLSSFQTPEVKQAYNELSEALGYDVLRFYKFKGQKAGTDIELRYDYKLPILLKFRDLCHKYGMEFYSAENSMRDFGDGAACCGVPENTPGFEGRMKENSSVAIFKARENGKVYFKDIFGDKESISKLFLNEEIGPWLNLGSTEGHLRSEGKTFLQKTAQIWDNPSSPNNPANFFKNLAIDGLDEDGHIVYKYIGDENACSSCKSCKGCMR